MSFCNSLKNKKFFLTLNLCGLSLLLSLLAGCGFKIRSQQSFPPQLHTIYFQAAEPYGKLAVALKKELKATHIALVDDVNKAPIIFHLGPETFGHTKDTSNTPSTQARIYHLNMATTLSITDAKGRTILEPVDIASARDLTLNSNEIFDTSTQVDVSKQSMRQEIVTKTLNLLSSQKIFTALNKPQ